MHAVTGAEAAAEEEAVVVGDVSLLSLFRLHWRRPVLSCVGTVILVDWVGVACRCDSPRDREKRDLFSVTKLALSLSTFRPTHPSSELAFSAFPIEDLSHISPAFQQSRRRRQDTQILPCEL